MSSGGAVILAQDAGFLGDLTIDDANSEGEDGSEELDDVDLDNVMATISQDCPPPGFTHG